MTYTVEWTISAEQELAELWLHPQLRPLIVQAANDIDTRLQLDPESVGESRDEGRRIEFEPPFAVVYSIDHSLRRVKVLHIWTF